jgi:hypothetical protein
MSDLDWWLAAVGASGAAIAALIAAVRGMRRRRRSETTARAPTLGDRRIDIVAIDERKWKR